MCTTNKQFQSTFMLQQWDKNVAASLQIQNMHRFETRFACKCPKEFEVICANLLKLLMCSAHCA